MWFFDTTPAGRILNRFSKDTYDMDHELPNVIFALGSHLLELSGLIIIVSIYQPYFLAGAVGAASMNLFGHLEQYHISCRSSTAEVGARHHCQHMPVIPLAGAV